MREIFSPAITEKIAEMCIRANTRLSPDMEAALDTALRNEDGPIAKSVLSALSENLKAAGGGGEAVSSAGFVPICQDTGMTCVFLELGQDVHIIGDLSAAVNLGVKRGYKDGYLRKSVVGDPLIRQNTGTNCPAVIYTELVPGDQIKITVAPKGFGSENMSAIKMLTPAAGIDGVIAFVLETVINAGPNACPPLVVGVGIGGTFDRAALLSKKALLRPYGSPSPLPHIAELEDTLLSRINATGIGPAGFGGLTTALFVSVETMATHIAGLPCAVNLCCHVNRHVTEVI